jgi:spore coat polysaccharide biosynthesis predicted glycosyltransferase SpsG
VRCLIVCQAGQAIGLGHLTRALTAAKALRHEIGGVVDLLVHGAVVDRDRLAGLRHEIVPAEADLTAAVRRSIQGIDPRVVLFDLAPRHVPPTLASLIDEIRRDGRRVVGIDDMIEHRQRLDLLFIPAFRANVAPVQQGAAPVLVGWDCLLVDVAQRSTPWTRGNRVLVLSGGSDAAGLGRTLPALLDSALEARAEIHWVVGPYAAPPALPEAPPGRIVAHHAPTDLRDLISSANYALTVFGVSFFELLRHGVPTVVFSPYGKRDEPEMAALASDSVAVVARDENDAVEQLRHLMADDAWSAQLSRQASERMKVSGGQKLARAVADLVA